MFWQLCWSRAPRSVLCNNQQSSQEMSEQSYSKVRQDKIYIYWPKLNLKFTTVQFVRVARGRPLLPENEHGRA